VTYDLTMECLIDGPPQEVFDAFVDPQAQKILYDNEEEPDWTVESELDLRVGGTWTIEFGKRGGGALPRDQRLHGGRPAPPARVRLDDGPGEVRRKLRHVRNGHLRGTEREDARSYRADRLRGGTRARHDPGWLAQHPGCARKGRRPPGLVKNA
jgi:uncharacterized protein YndB with AHSA1/START domain